jgi:N-acetylglucosaminyldiphosphoundecaprenol N-acetyl-beta-D-mannosaminyltransferase
MSDYVQPFEHNTGGTKALVLSSPRVIILLGVPFHDVTMQETLVYIDALIARGEPGYIATANLDFAAQASGDVELQRILWESELVLCDGTPLVWASRWLGAPLRERVAGSDLMPHLLAHAAEKGHRLFLLGATDEVLEKAAAKCRERYPNLNICGAFSPSHAKLLDLDHSRIESRIRESKPDILLVAMGCPKQEKWIYMNYRNLGVPVSMGVGASLDFMAGKFRRAPIWMRASGLEWVFRLLQEPRRLFNRYYLDLLFFVSSLRKQRRLLQQSGSGQAFVRRADHAVEPGVVQVNWSGRIDAAAVRSGVAEPILPEEGKPNVVLNCSEVTFLDSTGLGLLIKTFRSCKRAGGTLVVLDPTDPVESMLTLMQLARLIPIAHGDAEARNFLGLTTGVSEATTNLTNLTLTLALSGDVTAATVKSLEAELRKEWARASRASRLQLDLGQVTFIDSSGLGFLVKTLRLAKDRPAATLELLNPSPNVCNVIKLANLQALFGISVP